ncbi:MAG: peroxiredoxin [Candidatus Symbiobacter sp.]|nr:peroxiredoxin [Candidatus Symbiobacter sp.]
MSEQTLNTGDVAPGFNLACVGHPGGQGKLDAAELRGKPWLLYFYPKDDTSGCTKEACQFRDDWSQFQQISVPIIGVSRDNLASHEKFRSKYQLPFILLADEEGRLCQDYGVWVEKSMYGRKYMGIERASFLIDKAGKLAQIWRKVKVPGHSQEILQALSKLS